MLELLDTATKCCYKCKLYLPLTEFSKDNSRSDKLTALCRSCDSKKRDITRKKNQYQIFKDLLTLSCGHPGCEVNNIFLLTFHHLDPSEKDFHDFKRMSYESYLREKKKCKVLCRNHHEEIHALERFDWYGNRLTKNKVNLDGYKIIDTIRKEQAYCPDCQKEMFWAILQFHHLIKETKIADISELIKTRKGQLLLEDEIKKCVLLCPNCHAERHNQEHYKKAGARNWEEYYLIKKYNFEYTMPRS